jgi:hypothetical protein
MSGWATKLERAYKISSYDKYSKAIRRFLDYVPKAEEKKSGEGTASDWFAIATRECNKSRAVVIRSALGWLDGQFPWMRLKTKNLKAMPNAAREGDKKPHREVNVADILRVVNAEEPDARRQDDQLAFLLQYSLAGRSQDISAIRYG